MYTYLCLVDSPVILSQPESYTFNESTEAVLRCIATGIPPAAIYWQYEGEDITDGATFTITNTIDLRNDVYTTTSDLTITSVQRSNTGVYTCIAANGVPPNDTVTSDLTVNCEPTSTNSAMSSITIIHWYMYVCVTHTYLCVVYLAQLLRS